MGSEHLISLQPGTIIGGRYEVVKCLGAGSMGMVYACRHRELSGHMVAVKVLFPEVAQDKVAAARFRNEIFASYGVSHPNVVRAYEFIRDGDIIAYTMEYVGGGDLADRLGKPDKPIPIPEVVRLWSQMCLGVQAIHDAGIVHRDLKPENILISRDGVVKIADFGIARMGHGQKLTEHGGVVGTIDYVSPEYMINSQVDWRSDIYAMGILAYEMIAGESPFRADSVYATMTKRLKTDPTPPSSRRSECPAALDVIVLKAMHREPEQRYQSAMEIYQALEALMPGETGAPSHAVAGARRFNPAEPSRKVSEALVSSDTVEREQTAQPVTESRADAVRRPSGNFAAYGTEQVPMMDAPPQIAPVATRGWEEASTKMEPLLGRRKDAWGAGAAQAARQRPEKGGAATSMRGTGLIRPDRALIFGEPDARKGSRMVWLDIVIGLVAVGIGIGMGLFALNTFMPDIFGNISSETLSAWLDQLLSLGASSGTPTGE